MLHCAHKQKKKFSIVGKQVSIKNNCPYSCNYNTLQGVVALIQLFNANKIAHYTNIMRTITMLK